ncbi:MAG: DUF937 domain-containing protein [Cyanobacteria bacterium REEB459]|nr:DUF937 domain-containing protein [Cyanobacteria bacterium REEB459]
MGLFEQIIGAVASSGHLDDVLNTVEQFGSNAGIDTSVLHSVLPVVEEQIRAALQDKESNEGSDLVQGLISQFAGTSHSSEAVNAIFTPEVQQQIAAAVAERTGLEAGMIQQILPLAVPLVLNFFNRGGDNAP